MEQDTYTNNFWALLKRMGWLVLIPFVLDSFLLLTQFLNQGTWLDASKIQAFQLKFFVPSSLPSAKNMLDAFPDIIRFEMGSGFTRSGFSNLNLPEPIQLIYLVCGIGFFTILSAFLQGGFLGSIAQGCGKGETLTVKGFIHCGIHYWGRFLTITLLFYVCILLMLPIPWIFVIFIPVAIVLVFVPFVLVAEDISVLDAIHQGSSFFFKRFKDNLVFLIVSVLLFSVTGLLLIPLSNHAVFLGVLIYDVLAAMWVMKTMMHYMELRR